FLTTLEALTAPEAANVPSKQIEQILARGYEEYLELTYENAEARVEDLRQLARFATSFESTEAFLSELALVDAEHFGTTKGLTGEDVIEGAEEDEKLV